MPPEGFLREVRWNCIKSSLVLPQYDKSTRERVLWPSGGRNSIRRWVQAYGLFLEVVVTPIALIAFLTMQVGMHPRSIRPFVPLCGFVCSRPIALCVPPHSG